MFEENVGGRDPDAMDGTRENGTNYSGSKANRREQTRFEGGKTGFTRVQRGGRREGDKFEKTERQRGERK